MSNAQSNTETKTVENRPTKPNETGTISVQAHLRIYDPNTKKTIVETRG